MNKPQAPKFKQYLNFNVLIFKPLNFLYLFVFLYLFFGISSTSAFTDVTEDHQYFDAITFAYEEGIIGGFENGQLFKPEQVPTRAEILKITLGIRYSQELKNGCLREIRKTGQGFWYFPDVSLDDWFAGTVCLARQLTIVHGYSDGTFQPHRAVNFIEAAKIISKVFGIFESDNRFVSVLGEKNAIPNSINSLYAPVTRAEVAEIVYRLQENIVNRESKTYADLSAVSNVNLPGSRTVYQVSNVGANPSIRPSIVATTVTKPVQVAAQAPVASSAPCHNCVYIPKLGLQAPIVFRVGEDEALRQDWGALERAVMEALQFGVVHHPFTAMPGKKGNMVITGHSSFYQNKPGWYKNIFASIHKLNIGDFYDVYYNGQRFRYQVIEEKIILPNETDIYDQPGRREISTLVTCWPIYTSLKRKIIVGSRVF